jgi:hypothetical protein
MAYVRLVIDQRGLNCYFFAGLKLKQQYEAWSSVNLFHPYDFPEKPDTSHSLLFPIEECIELLQSFRDKDYMDSAPMDFIS